MSNGGTGYQEDTGMWQIWNTSMIWWHHMMRVVLVSALLCVSACTTPGRSSSTPTQPSPGAQMVPQLQGEGDGGNGM
jgi:hypothetical protein